MKENQHVQPVIDAGSQTVTFNVRGHDALVLHMDKLHPAIIAQAALVGMAQVRIVDAAAVSRTDKEGRIVPEDIRLAMKHERMAALIAHYETGTDQWSQRASGGGAPSTALTVEAIARVKACDYATARRYVDEYALEKFGGDNAKCLAFFRSAKAVKQAMLDIQNERLAESDAGDADEALSELMGK